MKKILFILLFLIKTVISFTQVTTFNVKILLPVELEKKYVHLSYYNGATINKINSLGDYITISDSLFSRFATLYIHIDSTDKNTSVRKSFYITNGDCKIIIKLKNPKLIFTSANAIDISIIEKKYNDFIKKELNDIDNFMRIQDTISSILSYNLNKQLREKLIKRQLLFIKKNFQNYYSFNLFKKFIVPSIFSNPNDNLNIFINGFPDEFKNTIEGHKIFRTIYGRKLATAEGDTCPDFITRDIFNRQISSGILKGKFFLINIWASWCIPCLAEIPTIAEIYKNVDSNKLNIISISIDTDSLKFIKAIEKNKIVWTNIFFDKDLVMKLGNAVSVPQLFLFDSTGKLIYNRTYRNDTDKKLPILKKILNENYLIK